MKVTRRRLGRISQGDIFKDVEFIEYVIEKKGKLEISKIVFPLVIVLTQDCDLKQDSKTRYPRTLTSNQDKLVLSVLVAPLYNVEHVYQGEHLDQLKITMQIIDPKGTKGKNVRNNEVPRYHYIALPKEIPITPSVIDFKHYFSVNIPYLRGKKSDFICRAGPLYREDISHRFASFLSRIGLPEDQEIKQ